MSDDALKLIVKISEGSVRDALSLLDRALLTLDSNKELDLKSAQNIFGFFDKSQLIELFEFILKGDENKVVEIYRKIYDQGIEPKIFINDFLELLYYFKNINFLTLEGTNFSLNDDEFKKIQYLSNHIDPNALILFWQFTISTLEELNIVSNQHLTIEMFLIRLMHLSSMKSKKKIQTEESLEVNNEVQIKKLDIEDQSRTVNQIKNIAQEEKITPEIQTEIKSEEKLSIKSLNELIDVCSKKKEIKLKYELEKNVNLVKFEKNLIEISFNESLDKNFVKDLSSKLFEWTNQRWIITFSQLKGETSVRNKKNNIKKLLINKAKETEIYLNVLKNFPDAELVDVKSKDDESDEEKNND